MKRIVAAAVLFFGTGIASAQNWQGDALKPKDACNPHKTSEWRCVAQGAGTVRVWLKKSAEARQKKVTFTYDEYHSSCGFPSKFTHGETLVTIASSDEGAFFALASGPVTGCREIYILNCKLDDVASNCQTVYESVSLRRSKGNKQ